MRLKLLHINNTYKKNVSIQIFGLVIGIVTCIFIGRNAFFEYSFDKFHKNGNQIYRTQNTEAMLLGPLARDNMSLVTDYARFHPCYRGLSIKSDEQIFIEENAYYADGSLFNIFTFPVKQGDAVSALNKKNHLVISESFAKKYFGNEEPVGKVLNLNGAYESNSDYTVGAVFKDIPRNSHIKFDVLLSLENILVHSMYKNNDPWRWENFFTYFKTNRGTDTKTFASNLSVIARTNGAPEEDGREPFYALSSLNELHLNGQTNFMDNNQNRSDVNIRVFLAFVVLFIAWLNYINISIGIALKTRKELGVKKVMGASPFRLWSEVFFKMLSISLIAVLISVTLYFVLQPFIKKITGNFFYLGSLNNILFWLAITGILFLGTFLVSFAIHYFQNRKKPLVILSDRLSPGNNKQSPWIALFVFQYSASIVLICFALFSSKQVNELMKVKTGIQTNEVLAVRSANTSDNGDINNSRAVFEDEVMKIPGVKKASSATYIPGSRIASYMPSRLPGRSEDENINCYMNFVGYNYIPLFKHKMIAGRNFSEDYVTDTEGVIINKTLARAYGFINPEDAPGKEIFWETRNMNKTIIGVVDDFHQQSADVPVEPMMFHLWDHARGYCLLSIESSNVKATVAEIENLWQKIHRGNAFDYLWVGEHYQKQFKKWIKYSDLVKVFSFIAVLIACVGLFGLSAMLLAGRTKELGVRKVNGAGEKVLIKMLNKEYINWIIVAFVTACPISWILMNRWLDNFAFKTGLSWWVFILAGFIALLVALFTVNLHTTRAVRKNPVEALRYE